jgi:peptidoglycan LD-endopeptidase CwlK
MKPLIILITFLLSPLCYSNSSDDPRRLIKAYPDFLVSYDHNFLVWKDGDKMRFDDKKIKDFNTLLNYPDLQDQLIMTYPIGNHSFMPPKFNHDPGRVRYEPMFKKMYGSNPTEVKKNLVKIIWLPKSAPQPILVTQVNGVNQKLQTVSNELDELPSNLKKYVTKLAGTYNWRTISGTNRLSAHSFGIAIDINVDYSDYWKWNQSTKSNDIEYKNTIPQQIVDIFEKNGFIWGGKWYHYDTMHFEYRPELLINSN